MQNLLTPSTMSNHNNSETVVTDVTILEESSSKNQEKHDNDNTMKAWQGVLLGGIPGIMLGATGAKASEVYSADEGVSEEVSATDDVGETVETSIPVATGINEQMSFREAFEEARAEVGPGGAFCWHGNVYSTYRSDDPEWENMTPVERNEHCQEIIAQVPAVPYTSTSQINHTDNTDNDEDIDVHIVGVGEIEAADGSVINAGYGSVDGHQAVFADTDGDGLVDTVLIDANDNGQVDSNELYSAEGANIRIEDLAAEAEMNHGSSVDPVDDQLFVDTPDYTNDADVSSFG